MMSRSFATLPLVLLLFLFLTAPVLAEVTAPAGTNTHYTLAEGSTITYHVRHPMHNVTGVGDDIKLLKMLIYDPAKPGDFSAIREVPIQAVWDSFDSGNTNRDSNTKMVVKAGQFPLITYVVEKIIATTRHEEHRYHAVAEGRMYVAGKMNPVTATLDIAVHNPERLEVRATSRIDMTDFDIDPPRLLLISADKWVRFETELFLRPTAP